MIVGSLFDLGIIFMSNKIKNFYDDPEKEDKETKEDKNDITMSDMVTNGVDPNVKIIEKIANDQRIESHNKV